MRIHREETTSIIIDIQEKLFPHINESAKLEEKCLKLISGLNVLDVPLLITEQYTKGLGTTINSIREMVGESYKPVEKMDFSCLGSTEFFNSLKNTGKKNVILLGIETHVCVLQTALDLLEHGYKPVIIENCVSSRNLNDKKIAIERMRSEGAIISTYESILFELCKVSGTDKFKEISKIVK